MILVTIKEGQAFAIADRIVRVDRILMPGRVRLTIDGENEPVIVSWDRKFELFPEITITMHRDAHYPRRIKLVLEAPDHIHVSKPQNEGTG